MRARGIDISYWDISFDPSKAIEPLDFVIQRTGYGLMVDKCFNKFQEAVLKVPIRGAYHYLSTAVPWQVQADKFLSLVMEKDYHFYVCDFEGAYNAMSIKFSMEANQWMNYVAVNTKKPVLLYTNPSLYDGFAWHYCTSWPLWIAQYYFIMPNPDTGKPRMPARKSEWLIWQYTDNGKSRAYGCGANEVDVNVFNGTVADMRTWLKLDEPPPAIVPVRERACPYQICPTDGL